MALNERRLGVALFGVGRIGSVHLKNVRQHARLKLVYVVDIDEATALKGAKNALGYEEENQRTYKICAVQNMAEIMTDTQVDVVVITTPTSSHENIILTSLLAGKHVFCEKPLTATLKGAIDCYSVAKDKGLHLMTAFQRRFDPSVGELRRRICGGDLGKLQIVKSCSRDSPAPPIEYLRTSGGIFHDCAIHDLDTVCWLADEWPHTVYASGFAHDPDIEALGDVDTAVALLTFPSGLLATIDVSRNSASYGYDQRLEIFGEKGMLRMENEPHTLVNHAGPGSASETEGEIKDGFLVRYKDAYVNELDHFVKLLQGNEKEGLTVTEESWIKVFMLAEASEHSRKTGEPVKMGEFIKKKLNQQ